MYIYIYVYIYIYIRENTAIHLHVFICRRYIIYDISMLVHNMRCSRKLNPNNRMLVSKFRRAVSQHDALQRGSKRFPREPNIDLRAATGVSVPWTPQESLRGKVYVRKPPISRPSGRYVQLDTTILTYFYGHLI